MTSTAKRPGWFRQPAADLPPPTPQVWVNLDGVNGYARAGAGINALAPFSIRGWFKGPPTGPSAGTIMGVTSPPGLNGYLLWRSTDLTARVEIWLLNDQTQTVARDFSTLDVFTDEWVSLALTGNGSRLLLYVNGQLDPVSLPFQTGGSAVLSNTTFGSFYGGSPAQFQQGQWHDWAHYDYELSAAQVTPESWPTNPVQWWKMDEGTGPTLNNSAGPAFANLVGGYSWGQV